MTTLDPRWLNLGTLIVLAVGLYCLLRLGWADRWHHLYFALLGFCFTGADYEWLRGIAVLIALDDAIQHLVQWVQWSESKPHPRVNGFVVMPDEGTGWPGIYRSPLHCLYWRVYQRLEHL